MLLTDTQNYLICGRVHERAEAIGIKRGQHLLSKLQAIRDAEFPVILLASNQFLVQKFSREFRSHIVCLIIVLQLTSVLCVRLQFWERENAGFCFGLKLSWNIPHCWLCFCGMKHTTLLIVLLWHETYHIADCASAVSTEKYNVNSILCQCTMVLIAKCQIKFLIVLHFMVNIEAKEVKKWNKAKRVLYFRWIMLCYWSEFRSSNCQKSTDRQ